MRVKPRFAHTLAINARGQNADITVFQSRLIARFGDGVCIDEDQVEAGVALKRDGKPSWAGDSTRGAAHIETPLACNSTISVRPMNRATV